MASPISICNGALQRLGQKPITDLDQNSPLARSCKLAYPKAVKAELRAHPWNFAIKRASLAAASEQTVYGGKNRFPLPSDFLRLLPDPDNDTNDLDNQREGNDIVTYADAPLNIRYIWNVTDTNLFDSLFSDALEIRIALMLVEELTQSNTKKAGLKEDYKDVVREARHTNAMENRPAKPPEDTFVTVRN